MEKQFSVTLEATPGARIARVIEHAIWFSRSINQEVTLIFNEKRIDINPESTDQEAYDQYINSFEKSTD